MGFIPDNKVININPIFVEPTDFKYNFDYFKLPIFLIVIFELFLIGFLLYFYFIQEFKFLFYSLKPKTKQYDKSFINKVADLKTYKYKCSNGDVLVYNQSHSMKAKYLNNDVISFSDDVECNEFLNKIEKIK